MTELPSLADEPWLAAPSIKRVFRAIREAGGEALDAKVAAMRPRPKVVAVLGLTAYRQAFSRPKAQQGRQPERLGGVPLWVLPNPSGLNAHDTVASLATAYREAWDAAG